MPIPLMLTVPVLDFQVDIPKDPCAEVGSFDIQMKISEGVGDRVLQHVGNGVDVVQKTTATRLQGPLKGFQVMQEPFGSVRVATQDASLSDCTPPARLLLVNVAGRTNYSNRRQFSGVSILASGIQASTRSSKRASPSVGHSRIEMVGSTSEAKRPQACF